MVFLVLLWYFCAFVVFVSHQRDASSVTRLWPVCELLSYALVGFSNAIYMVLIVYFRICHHLFLKYCIFHVRIFSLKEIFDWV